MGFTSQSFAGSQEDCKGKYMNPPAQWETDGRNLLQWEAGEEEERDGGSTGDAGGLVRCLGCSRSRVAESYVSVQT